MFLILSFSVLLTGCSITPILLRPDLPSLRFPASFINHLLSPSSLPLSISLSLSVALFFALLAFSSSPPSSPLVAANLYAFIFLFITTSLSLCWLVNYLSLSFPRYYQRVSLPLHSIISLFSCLFSLPLSNYVCAWVLQYISMVVCELCREVERIAQKKRLVYAANIAFKLLIHSHLAVQLPCTDSLKLYFCLMKMHQGLVHWNLIFHIKWFDHDPVAVPNPDVVHT